MFNDKDNFTDLVNIKFNHIDLFYIDILKTQAIIISIGLTFWTTLKMIRLVSWVAH